MGQIMTPDTQERRHKKVELCPLVKQEWTHLLPGPPPVSSPAKHQPPSPPPDPAPNELHQEFPSGLFLQEL